jgi:hypothetical protein
MLDKGESRDPLSPTDLTFADVEEPDNDACIDGSNVSGCLIRL